MLILRDAFLGVRRFDDFVERLGISRNVLTNRLDTLVATGVLERRPYDEARGRYDYLLTDKGRALWPVMTALRQWGDQWIYGPGNEPLLLEHRSCGCTTTAQMTCDTCGETLDARSVRAIPGPGADERHSPGRPLTRRRSSSNVLDSSNVTGVRSRRPSDAGRPIPTGSRCQWIRWSMPARADVRWALRCSAVRCSSASDHNRASRKVWTLSQGACFR